MDVSKVEWEWIENEEEGKGRCRCMWIIEDDGIEEGEGCKREGI